MRFLLHTVHFLYKVVKYPVWSENIEGEMHMEIQILPLIIVVAYLVGMLVVGAVVSRVQIKNAKDYMVAGRRMGLFMVAFSLSANNIGGGCTTAWPRSLRRLGRQRCLVRPGGVHRHDSSVLFCT